MGWHGQLPDSVSNELDVMRGRGAPNGQGKGWGKGRTSEACVSLGGTLTGLVLQKDRPSEV